MSDLISRQDLIELLNSRVISSKGIFGDLGGAVSGVRELIKAIPSAEPERKWIPVSEALPEICQKDVRGNVTFSKQVWSCQKYGDGFFWQSIDQYTTNNGGGWLSEVPHDDPNDCCKVVAWMPLPEPYGGE